ncbi:MAG: hypothetical protein HY054_16225 [Proteobacteria bacterium]|nr:hypothetical protein [Pseudomonadota bacterium]
MIIQPDTETLLAVVLGAALATVGGFTERHVERLMRRREKARSAALLFGEILSAMRVMMRLANEARGRGDPYGPVTLRFVRAMQREVEICTRNRETLLDLRDAQIRANISVLIARLSFSLDGVTDATTELSALEKAPADGASASADHSQQARAALNETRKTAFDFAVETAAEITPLLTRLAPLAQHDFGATRSALPADMFDNPADEPV